MKPLACAVVAACLTLLGAAPAEADFGFLRAWGKGVSGGSGFEVCTSACQAGLGGSEPGALASPAFGIAVGPSGDVYVADSANDRIEQFSPAGTFVRSWGQPGALPGQFQGPHGLALDGAGNVYVADTGNDRVQKFTSSGAFVRAWGTTGSGAGQLISPAGLGVDPAGTVYVANTNNHRIDQFTSLGAFVRGWGKGVNGGTEFGACTPAHCQMGIPDGSSGALADPKDAAVGANGDVYVADRDNSRIAQFSSTGAFVRAWGRDVGGGGGFEVCTSACQKGATGQAGGELAGQFWGLATDPAGNVYVADENNNRVQEFTAGGGFVRTWGKGVNGGPGFEVCTSAPDCKAGSAGSGDGELGFPLDVAVGCSGPVFVVDADMPNRRVAAFGDPAAPSSCPRPGTSTSTSGDLPAKGSIPAASTFRLDRPHSGRDGTATLSVVVPGPGRLVAEDASAAGSSGARRRVGRIKRTVIRTRRAGKAVLKLRPSATGQRLLRRNRKLRVRVRVTFTPTAGRRVSRVVRVTLRKRAR